MLPRGRWFVEKHATLEWIVVARWTLEGFLEVHMLIDALPSFFHCKCEGLIN
jgi:hypothetical protein